METIGERLKFSREQKRMNQDEVAGLLGISRKSVINHESGANRPSAALLKRYAELYQAPWEWLLTGQSVEVPSIAESGASYSREIPTLTAMNEEILVHALRLLDEKERYSFLLNVFHSLAEKRNHEHDETKKAHLNWVVEALKKAI